MCPTCKGSGKVFVWDPSIRKHIEVPCPTCQGRGTLN